MRWLGGEWVGGGGRGRAVVHLPGMRGGACKPAPAGRSHARASCHRSSLLQAGAAAAQGMSLGGSGGPAWPLDCAAALQRQLRLCTDTDLTKCMACEPTPAPRLKGGASGPHSRRCTLCTCNAT